MPPRRDCRERHELRALERHDADRAQAYQFAPAGSVRHRPDESGMGVATKFPVQWAKIHGRHSFRQRSYSTPEEPSRYPLRTLARSSLRQTSTPILVPSSSRPDRPCFRINTSLRIFIIPSRKPTPRVARKHGSWPRGRHRSRAGCLERSGEGNRRDRPGSPWENQGDEPAADPPTTRYFGSVDPRTGAATASISPESRPRTAALKIS